MNDQMPERRKMGRKRNGANDAQTLRNLWRNVDEGSHDEALQNSFSPHGFWNQVPLDRPPLQCLHRARAQPRRYCGLAEHIDGEARCFEKRTEFGWVEVLIGVGTRVEIGKV